MMDEDIVVTQEDASLVARIDAEPDISVMTAESDIFSAEQIQEIVVGPDLTL